MILTGARQTGKTTLCRTLYPELRYLNLDALENREWVREVSAFHWARDVGEAVIDEAQKESAVFEKVKYAFDEGALDFSVLTGSAQLLLLSQVRESLAGRAFVYELWPLMLCELAATILGSAPVPPIYRAMAEGRQLSGVLQELPLLLAPEREQALADLLQYMLRWGGMPELLRLEGSEREEWMRSYEITYLERDLGDLARLTDLLPFKKFQRLAALRSGCMLVYSELAKESGFSSETARRYLEYLRLSYQAFLLQPYHTNLTSQVVKTPKVYWGDVGLLRQLTGQSGGVSGSLLETFVVAELNKWARGSGADLKLFYYRTRSGLEVDLLLESKRGLYGIEIKSGLRVDQGDAAGLRQVAEAAGKRWLGGMVAYQGRRLELLCEPAIWAVPVGRLCSGEEGRVSPRAAKKPSKNTRQR